MDKIGDYEYPTHATFQDALIVADGAINRFGGIIPNIEVKKTRLQVWRK